MNGQQIQVNIDQGEISAKYCDQAMISHNPFGFAFDFAQQIPQMNMLKILSRIAMSPEHAKAFSEALLDNLEKYEEKFGEIELTKTMREQASSPKKIGFHIEEQKRYEKQKKHIFNYINRNRCPCDWLYHWQ